MNVTNQRRRKGAKVYKKKTYRYVHSIWRLWIQSAKLGPSTPDDDVDESGSESDSESEE